MLVFNSLFKIKKNTNPDVNIDIDGIKLENVPQHIAIIMDGNGRWAKAQGKVRTFGHQAGAETLKTIVKTADKIGVKVMLFQQKTGNGLLQRSVSLWSC